MQTDLPKSFHLIKHPMVMDALAHLRDRTTEVREFRYYSDQLCRFLFAAALEGLDFREQAIDTPISPTKVYKLRDRIVVIPVLRAGLAMLPSVMGVLPKSEIGFAGLVRDEETAQASEYYWKLPPIDAQSVVLIPDPMLATGGSFLHVLGRIMPLGPKSVRLVSVVAAPEGVTAILSEYPDLKIFVAALDEKLDERKYIVPGLGDYGDRYFGTTAASRPVH